MLALALQERCLQHLRAGHDSLLIKTVPMGEDVAPARGKFPSSPGDLIDKFDYLWKNPGESAENEMHSGSVEATTDLPSHLCTDTFFGRGHMWLFHGSLKRSDYSMNG